MKKIGGKIAVVLAVIALLGVYYYVALPAVNIHATEFWIFLVILVVLAALIYVRKKKLNRYEMKESKGLKAILTVLVVIVAVYLLGSLLSSPIVNAKKYQKLMKVETGEFTKDIEELSFDQIPLLDRDSAISSSLLLDPPCNTNGISRVSFNICKMSRRSSGFISLG